ncbi:hypothetical protein Tco_1315663 [Tanacetum coccineum]
MDDEPMWAADCVVAPTPGFAITIPETANEFAIKANSFPPPLFDRFLGEIRAFSQHKNESLTDAWLRMKEMLRNFHGHNLSKGSIIKIFYHGLNEITQEVLNTAAGGIFIYKTPNQAYQLVEDKLERDSCDEDSFNLDSEDEVYAMAGKKFFKRQGDPDSKPRGTIFHPDPSYSTPPDDIRRHLELERVMVDRTIKSQTVTLTPNQILTKELSPNMKQWEELIRENVFGLEGHRDHLPACLAHMLYCVVAEEQYNLVLLCQRISKCASSLIQPPIFHMVRFLTRLYRHIMKAYPHLNNGIYDIDDRVMRPLALKQTRRPQSDHGKERTTPSPTTYLNSLNPLNYQNYKMPSASEQTDETLFERQSTLLNQTQEMHKEMRGGFKSFGKALKGVFSKKKK